MNTGKGEKNVLCFEEEKEVVTNIPWRRTEPNERFWGREERWKEMPKTRGRVLHWLKTSGI